MTVLAFEQVASIHKEFATQLHGVDRRYLSGLAFYLSSASAVCTP
jgi:hypothetical protein